MKIYEDEDVIYGTSLIQKYLQKYHSIEVTQNEINLKMNQLILDETEKEEVCP